MKKCNLVTSYIFTLAFLLISIPIVDAQVGQPKADGAEQDVNLNGFWMDNGRWVRILQLRTSVYAKYSKPYECNPGYGFRSQSTYDDFEATLLGRRLEGKTTTCDMCTNPEIRTTSGDAACKCWDNPSILPCYGIGETTHIYFKLGLCHEVSSGTNDPEAKLYKSPMKLTLSPDGQTLDGTYYDHYEDKWVPMKLERVKPCLMREGFVYVTPRKGAAAIRNWPSTGRHSQIIGSPSNGARILYTNLVEENGRITWLYVEPVGSTPGWISADDVSLFRPPPVPPTRPGPLPPSSGSRVSTQAAACTSARG